MFRYRLHSSDGDDLGEATYAQMIRPGEEVYVNGARSSASWPWCRSGKRTSRPSWACYRSSRTSRRASHDTETLRGPLLDRP